MMFFEMYQRKGPVMAENKAVIEFDSDRCKGCGLCVIFCPHQNIRMSDILNEQGHPYAELVDADRCTGCGLCYRMCPDTAIAIHRSKTAKR